jgi:NitT/TauT family transport system permease protein
MAGPQTGRGTRAARWVRGAAGLAVFLAAFEALGRAGIVDRSYLPPASAVLERAFSLLGRTDFLDALGATLATWALGLAVAAVAATAAGVLLGSLPGVNAAAAALVEFLRPVPSVALIPLAGLVLGSGLAMKTSMVVYASVWPVLYNTIYGLADVDPTAKDTLRAFGFGPLQVLWRVSLPSATPYIATGIRLAAAVALILTVSTEMLTGVGVGLGVYIQSASTAAGNADVVLACVFWAGVLGLLVDTAFVAAERRVFRWHHARTERAA